MAIINSSRISGLAKIDPSSLEFPLGGEERAAGVYGVIHDCREQRSQQRGQIRMERISQSQRILLRAHKGAKQELRSVKPKCDGYIISVQNLKVSYDQKVILEKINFEVYAGDRFLIIGSSGCGKTTLLNAMIGLHQETSGKIIIDGDTITNASDKIRQKVLRRIGVMYQSGALFGSLTLLENVMFPLEELTNLPKEAIKEIAISKLETVGLGNFINYMPTEMSGGMQKRAAIARAMVLEPKIIFLDEPFSGLDPTTAAQIDKLILMLSQILKITFVIVTHELASIFNIATRVIMLHEKGIIAEGDPNELHKNCTNSVVQKFFNRLA